MAIIITFVYFLASVGGILILIFLWNLLRADLKIKLDNNKITKANCLYNEKERKKYLICITELFKYLEKYNYHKKYKKREPTIFKSAHTAVTSAYNDLKSLEKQIYFIDNELANKLNHFLNFFEYWCISSLIAVFGDCYNIKPIFKAKNEFDKQKNKINILAKEIVNKL
jgi:hypothetical protein